MCCIAYLLKAAQRMSLGWACWKFCDRCTKSGIQDPGVNCTFTSEFLLDTLNGVCWGVWLWLCWRWSLRMVECSLRDVTGRNLHTATIWVSVMIITHLQWGVKLFFYPQRQLLLLVSASMICATISQFILGNLIWVVEHDHWAVSCMHSHCISIQPVVNPMQRLFATENMWLV